MCRIKEYSKMMQSHLGSILLRFDTYLLYDDFNKCATKLKEISNGIPSDVPFDEINEQLIDIDSVAELRDTYINKVIETDLVSLTGARLNEIKCDIYVNPYFIAFSISSDGASIETSVENITATAINVFQELGIHVNDIYLRLNYFVDKRTDADLWNICDKSAFPVMEGNGYNGQYTDSIIRDGIFLDLTRTISPSDEKINPELSDVIIQTKAVLTVSATENIAECIKNVVKLSKDEVTRCFTN